LDEPDGKEPALPRRVSHPARFELHFAESRSRAPTQHCARNWVTGLIGVLLSAVDDGVFAAPPPSSFQSSDRRKLFPMTRP
jgi:hypothetical protein